MNLIHAALASKFCTWYHTCPHVATVPGGKINGLNGPEWDGFSSINEERQEGALDTEQKPNSLPVTDFKVWECSGVALCSPQFLQVLPL